MKIDQIAFGCDSKNEWDKHAKNAEVVDTVFFSGRSKPPGKSYFNPIENRVGYLAFNYIDGMEMEYLYYPITAGTFHEGIGISSWIFLSHLGSHINNIDSYLEENGDKQVVMDVTTFRHSNPKLIELGRTYRYVILDWRMTHGYFYKLIQRIENNGPATA